MILQNIVARRVDSNDIRNRRLRLSAIVFAAIALTIFVNAFAAAYVASEHYIYYWDWSRYWLKYGLVGRLFRTDMFSAIGDIFHSINNEDYNILPIVPLVPFELAFGPGRSAYILAITNAALLPAVALLAWVAERTADDRSWFRYFFCTALLVGFHVLWAPVLRGLPDAFGLVIACLVLMTWLCTPLKYRLLKMVGLGALLCLLVLTRRWYLFWAVAFFPAALLALAFEPNAAEFRWKGLLSKSSELFGAGVICTAFVFSIAAPLVAHLATANYSAAYAAYRPELAGATGSFGQIINQFGIALLAICALGLVLLIRRRGSRELGVLLGAQAFIAVGLFSRVQGFFGVQHFYLLVPAAAIGLAGLVIAIWNAPWQPIWRVTGIGFVSGVILVSSFAVFDRAIHISSPILPRVRYAPLVRLDLPEINRLMDVLYELKAERVYIAASSEILNSDTLSVGCRADHKALCGHIAETADIDTRDGFPINLLDADYVVVATPTQYHVLPADQRVVGLVAEHVIQHTGFGSSFEPVRGEFILMNGVHVQIYRRIAPLRHEDVRGLSDELIRSYPGMRDLFTPPSPERT